jgi:hypothetical protein
MLLVQSSCDDPATYFPCDQRLGTRPLSNRGNCGALLAFEGHDSWHVNALGLVMVAVIVGAIVVGFLMERSKRQNS